MYNGHTPDSVRKMTTEQRMAELNRLQIEQMLVQEFLMTLL